MDQKSLKNTFLPELGIPRRGKVRDIYEGQEHFTFITSDRISVFDRILEEAVPDKGQILCEISNFWFRETEDIIQNHIVDVVDPNVVVVRKCQPLKVEVVVRSRLTGSLFRDYAAGKREKCGVPLPEGLKEHDALPRPIITPTTKSEEGHDEDITPEELIEKNIVAKELWREIERTAMQLFERGGQLLKSRGLILVDTKYEFGIDASGKLTLIDEIHTPDSSRFWFAEDFARKEVKFPDKEFAREYCRSRGFIGEGALPKLPEEVIEKVQCGYRSLYEKITGKTLGSTSENVRARLLQNLRRSGIIKGYFALVVASDEEELPYARTIGQLLSDSAIPHRCVVAASGKSDGLEPELLKGINDSIEPVVCIAATAKIGALADIIPPNLRWPLIVSPPPHNDIPDAMTKIVTALQMQSETPALLAVQPIHAALAAEKILKTMEIA